MRPETSFVRDLDLVYGAASKNYPVDAFRADLTDICGQFDVEPERSTARRLRGHLSVCNFAGLDIAHVGQDCQIIRRTANGLRRDPGDHFFLIMQRHGRSSLEQGDAVAHLDPGDMFLVDSTQQSVFRFHGRYSLQLSVHLPRAEMCKRFGPRIRGGIAIKRNDPFCMSMQALLAKLFHEADTPQAHVVEAFYSVFGALLTEREFGRGLPPDADSQIVQRALSIIAESYFEADFTTRDLAEIIGLPLRRVQRAFQAIGETPRERLQRFRIEAAHLALARNADRRTPQTIAAIAFSQGFGDLSTFYRLYRKTYGHAPGDTLAIGPSDV
ncbi:MAG: helix-turn-helix domain-containing protein [Pseudomonadota bacterium]